MRFVLAALAAGIGFLAFMADRSWKGHRGRGGPLAGYAAHPAPASDTRSHIHKSPAGIATVTSHFCGDTNQRKHQEAERRFWRRSEIISGVTALSALAGPLFAAFALFLSWKAVEEARRQADTAQLAVIAANRPWIKVIHLSTSRLSVINDTVIFSTNVNVTNIGTSPAQKSFVRAELIPAFHDVFYYASQAKLVCDQATDWVTPFEELIFPGEGRLIWHVSSTHMEAVREAREEYIRTTYIRTPAAQKIRDSPFSSAFVLVGCITYETPNLGTIGQTAFIYDIDRPCDFGPVGRCTFDMTKQAVFEKGEVGVQQSVVGAFAR